MRSCNRFLVRIELGPSMDIGTGYESRFEIRIKIRTSNPETFVFEEMDVLPGGLEASVKAWKSFLEVQVEI